MFEIPVRERLMIYGSRMVNVESEPVDPSEYHLLPKLREYMVGVMLRNNGIGLAAPQVGIFRQFFVMRTDNGSVIDVVNPEVIQMYGHEKKGFEACLSLPPVGNGCAEVPRLEMIRVEYGSSEDPGCRTLEKWSGMDAIVAQHELDHLTGTFFVDRIKDKQREIVMKSFNKWRDKRYATHSS